MMAEAAIRPTAIGFEPLTRAGNKNLTRMKPAKASPSNEANPRHRATTMTTRAKTIATASNGKPRSKSENW